MVKKDARARNGEYHGWLPKHLARKVNAQTIVHVNLREAVHVGGVAPRRVYAAVRAAASMLWLPEIGFTHVKGGF